MLRTSWRLPVLQGGGWEPYNLVPQSVASRGLPVTYLPRIVDTELDARLGAAGAVVIEGPNASGKTETARQRAASSVLLDVDGTHVERPRWTRHWC